ncbi:sensor domain-containing diguanylate cyclase [Paenibacillus pini]|uniref:GGDEF domain-containing protein n=1 Tax=Paenibacillus pini JCM 16418 TaxID=1236976 RepID=W7YER7_9BACL|nr:GGDEF domain-containing protein [Paenibacillus pini]GAF09430.1 hypothetical Protein JCM16418_3571 [Paenibacillus pini JCM 16418]
MKGTKWMNRREKYVTQLLNIPASLRQKKIAWAAALFIFLATVAVLPFGTRMLPEVKPFLPMFVSWFIFGDLMTSYLLFIQYRASKSIPQLVLACSYLFTGFIIIPHILTFPGVFSDTGLIGAGDQSAVWLWVFWHGGFPAGVMLYLLSDVFFTKSIKPQMIFRFGVYGVGITVAVLATIYVLVTLGNDLLPRIIQKGNYRILITSGVGPVVWLLNLLALFLMIRIHKARDVLNLWLTVAVFASLLDVTLTLFAGERYSLGWYVARVNSLVATTAVIFSISYEINRLYVRLADQQDQLVDSQARLTRVNDQLMLLSSLDGLTGIANRRHFDERLLQELELAGIRKSPLSLLMLDVDHFKAYNDYYGHLGGDAVLQRVAQSIHSAVELVGGMVARYGGEEFAVILPGKDHREALNMAEQIRRMVEGQHIPHAASKGSPWITISVGGYTMDRDESRTEMTANLMITLADQALYQAKEGGRNRTMVNDILVAV